MSRATEEIENVYRLTPTQMGDALKRLIEADMPVMVWGPPGVGKTDVSKGVANELGMNYLDVRTTLVDPVDLRGIPWRDENQRTRWAPPVFMPDEQSDERFLINLEELPSAPPMVQAALYQLTLDRALGEARLPKGAFIMGCGNRENDRGVVHRMPTPLASRFTHIELVVDPAEWVQWALTNRIAPEVIYFIRARDELLHSFDANSAEKAFPCPRTWSFVSKLLDVAPKDKGGKLIVDGIHRSLIKGTVGEGAMIEFAGFLELYKDLPAPETVINDPANAPIPDNPSALIMLCASLCRRAEDAVIESMIVYAKRLRVEVGEFMIQAAVQREPSLQYTKSYVDWTIYTSKN